MSSSTEPVSIPQNGARLTPKSSFSYAHSPQDLPIIINSGTGGNNGSFRHSASMSSTSGTVTDSNGSYTSTATTPLVVTTSGNGGSSGILSPPPPPTHIIIPSVTTPTVAPGGILSTCGSTTTPSSKVAGKHSPPKNSRAWYACIFDKLGKYRAEQEILSSRVPNSNSHNPALLNNPHPFLIRLLFLSWVIQLMRCNSAGRGTQEKKKTWSIFSPALRLGSAYPRRVGTQKRTTISPSPLQTFCVKSCSTTQLISSTLLLASSQSIAYLFLLLQSFHVMVCQCCCNCDDLFRLLCCHTIN